MMKMNKKVEYGVMALLHLGHEDMASVKEMACRYHIPENLLSKIMQVMKNVGIVESVHGNQGGYRLRKALSEINLLDLSDILVGRIHIADCLHPEKRSCPANSACSIVSPVQLLNDKIVQLFRSTSVESLSQGGQEKNEVSHLHG